MGYKIEKTDEDNNNNEYEYLDETLHFLDEEEDEEIIQDVIEQTIEEHEKEKEIFFKWFKKGVESMFYFLMLLNFTIWKSFGKNVEKNLR